MPRLSPECDPTMLSLSPAEGYLLSRVDGATSWSMLRQIGGLPPGDVDRCLEGWLRDGVLVVGDDGGLGADPFAAAPEPEAVPAIDPGLDIGEADQRRVLEFEARLGASYYEILGVPRDADVKAIKRAYFRLSKDFHPDRYFRRQIGPYRARLDRIFKKVIEAYELLSDPAARAEIDRTLPGQATPEEAAGAGKAAAGRAPARKRPRRPLRSLGVLSRVVAERKRKAKRFYETGMAAFAAERWLEASASIRLAIAFDPQNEAFKDGFVDVVRKANEVRSAQILREADAALDLRQPEKALAFYEEALHLRPHDPDVNYTAARLAFVIGKDLRVAKEYATRACEMDPEKAVYHRLLGQIYAAAGLAANAQRELEAALRIDPKDAEAKSALRKLRRA